jgi:hypothetical protein
VRALIKVASYGRDAAVGTFLGAAAGMGLGELKHRRAIARGEESSRKQNLISGGTKGGLFGAGAGLAHARFTSSGGQKEQRTSSDYRKHYTEKIESSKDLKRLKNKHRSHDDDAVMHSAAGNKVRALYHRERASAALENLKKKKDEMYEARFPDAQKAQEKFNINW